MDKVFQITLDAQALWGSQIVCQICGKSYPQENIDYCCLNDNGVTPSCLAWQYHLLQMADLSEKEKFKYVARFLDILRIDTLNRKLLENQWEKV
jgi:hypothetical protein